MSRELSDTERAACEVVRRVLSADVEPWDVAGRQRAVDAVLRYSDGRTGALEVTQLAADRAHQLDRHVGDEALSWPLPGRRLWTVALGDVRELPRLSDVLPSCGALV